MKGVKIIIPARLGSKGLPFKNRKLFKYTAESIPEELKSSTWVTSNDLEIINYAKEYNFNRVLRPSSLANDETSTKEVILHALDIIKPDPEDTIILLYLTYPQRTWQRVESAFSFFKHWNLSRGISSLLCKKEVKVSPYLCLQETDATSFFGKQIVPHDLYRRQDYPKCFELSHFISMFRADAINNLNQNLYNEKTVFYPIDEIVDVDTQKDLDNFNELGN
jgi:CMP-N-acetylneuraminic acid synthetase